MKRLFAFLLLVPSLVFGGATVGASSGGGGGTPGGSNTYVQFNDSGAFGGASTFTYNKSTGAFTINGVTIDSSGNIVSPGALSVSNLIPTTITWGSTVVPVVNGGTGITAFGTGVATGLGVNVGSAGAFVTNGGALGTPSGGTGTNITGIPAANILSGALVNGMTATTQSAGSVDTKLATDTYANTAAYATHLGTFASPDTTAGSITWTSPVLNIFTSASAALRTYTLPAASSYSGQAFILNVAVGTNHVNVQPASGAQLVLAGVLLTANHYVQAATSAAGNYICFVSDGTNWCSLGNAGTWADASSP